MSPKVVAGCFQVSRLSRRVRRCFVGGSCEISLMPIPTYTDALIGEREGSERKIRLRQHLLHSTNPLVSLSAVSLDVST